MSDNKIAVVLLSGGLDSATVAAMARHEGFAVHAMTISYGQRHAVEIDAARRVVSGLGLAKHVFVDIPLAQWGGSALTDSTAVPKGRDAAEMEAEIPVTYVPARNTVFLSFALGYSEVVGARDIFAGMNQVDYSGYPDCRPAFVSAFENLANLATKAGVEGDRFRIHAPLMDMNKAEIIRRGEELGVDFAWTHSCYDPSPDGRACGECDSCLIRKRAFAELGRLDPVLV